MRYRYNIFDRSTGLIAGHSDWHSTYADAKKSKKDFRKRRGTFFRAGAVYSEWEQVV